MNELPKVTIEYWEAEFAGAFGKEQDWDGRAYESWNAHLNAVALEGEALLQ